MTEDTLSGPPPIAEELTNVSTTEAHSAVRGQLFRRLVDLVALPTSTMAVADRAMCGDILLELLFEADDADRAKCAKRLANATEAPRRLLRYLALGSIETARPLLEENNAFDASDLAQIVSEGTAEHRSIIARRRDVPAGVVDAIVDSRDLPAIRAALQNRRAVFSETALDQLIQISRTHEDLCSQIVERAELYPSQALTMFWWANQKTRQRLLLGHASDRVQMIEACSDLFAGISAEGWRDPVARKALQLVERRQRNRAARERSPFDDLEHAIEQAANDGMTAHIAQEIGFLSGLKPVTIAQILSDMSGEGIGVLCKGTRLKRPHLRQLWHALRRPLESENGMVHPHFARVEEIYDLLTLSRAQTILRYWNWSLTSAKPRTERDTESGDQENFSTAQRSAKLVLGR